MQQLASVGNLNESVTGWPAEPARLAALWTAGQGSSDLANWSGTEAGSPVPARIEPPPSLAELPWPLVRRGALASVPARPGNDSSSLLHHAVSIFDDDRRGRLVPYLALIRTLLEHNEIAGARMVLEAVPSDIAGEPPVRRLMRLLAPPRISLNTICDVDRSPEYRWLRLHGQDYRGQWVALHGERLVASAPSLKALQEALSGLDLIPSPLVHRLD